MRAVRLSRAALLAAALLCGAVGARAQEAPPRGSVVEVRGRACSYALYLPTAFTPERPWPVVLCFHPGGEGAVPVRLLAPEAERLGYLLVGSNDSRNGPWEEVVRAQEALWKEVAAQFSVAPGRAYAAGFSGGSRAALNLALAHPDRFAGALCCGAFGSEGRKVPKRTELALALVVGRWDFNLFEVTRAAKALPGTGADLWFEEFEGDHRWPPEALMAEGLQFLHAAAMRRGKVPEERAFLAEAAARRTRSAEALAGRWGMAAAAQRKFAQTAALFAPWADVTGAEARAAALAQAPEVLGRLALEARFEALRAELGGPLSSEALVRAARRLSKTAAQPGEEGEFAGVLLGGACLTLQERGALALGAGETRRALDHFAAAADLCPADPRSAYNAACLSARLRDREGALAHLRAAVAHGFRDRAFIQADRDWDRLRQDPEFQAILASMPP